MEEDFALSCQNYHFYIDWRLCCGHSLALLMLKEDLELSSLIKSVNSTSNIVHCSEMFIFLLFLPCGGGTIGISSVEKSSGVIKLCFRSKCESMQDRKYERAENIM